jgi:uncharacterized protein YbaP (TraB family)
MKRPPAPLCATALLLAVSAGACAGERHILWAAEGGKATVYLMGSIHLMKPESYPLDEIMEEAYRRSEIIAFETDLHEINSPRHAGLLMSKGLYLDGRTLEDEISPETMRMLADRTAELGMPLAEVVLMKPWFCSLTIYLKGLEQEGLDANYGLDAHFYMRARMEGKTTAALESADFQVGLLSALAEGDQEELLRQTLREEGFFAGGTDKLYRAWKEGDDGLIARYMEESLGAYPKMKDIFLGSRNRRWIAPIEAMLRAEKNALVVVGAGHLVGKESVVDLLRQRGWVVRQL